MTTEMLSTELWLREVAPKERAADFIASTSALDSHGEVVDQHWRLDRYRANPVVFYAHDHRDLPIGRAENVRVEDGKLQCRIVFATAEANPRAEHVWQSIQQRTLRAVSVGFVPNDMRLEKRNGEDVYVLTDNELHEVSVVPLPSNPEALLRMRTRAQERTAALRGIEENNMEEKEAAQLREKLAQRDADLKVAETKLGESQKEIVAARTATAETETKLKAVTTERDAAMDRATKAEGELVVREVKALVGVKITPAEEPAMIELARSNRGLFDQIIKARPDMPHTQSVMGTETVQRAAADTQALAARVSARA